MVRVSERFTGRDAHTLVNRSPEIYSSLASFHIVDDVLAGEGAVARLLDGAKPMVVGGGAYIH